MATTNDPDLIEEGHPLKASDNPGDPGGPRSGGDPEARADGDGATEDGCLPPSGPDGIEEPFLAVVALMSEPAAVLSEEGSLLYANQAMAGLLENGPGDLSGTPFRDHVHTDDRPAFETLLSEALSGASYRESRLAIADGRIIPVCLSLIAPRIEHSRVLLLLATDMRSRSRLANLRAAMEKLKDFERERLARETQYKALLRASSQSIFRMSRDWDEMRVLSPGKFSERSSDPETDWIDRYIPPGEREPLRQAILEALAARRPLERDQRYLRRDGTVGWAQFRAVPIEDEAGEIVEWLGAGRDITERKRAEEALRDSEQRLQLALEHGQMGMWEWDIRTGRALWNQKAYELIGLPPGAGGEDPEAFWERVHPEDAGAARARVDQVLREGTELADEFRVILPGGQVRWLQVRGRLLRCPAGTPQRMVGVTFDITVRKRFEQALLESEEMFKSIFNNNPEAMVICTYHEGELIEVNDAFFELSGYSREEALGKTTTELNLWVAPGARESVIRLLEAGQRIRDFQTEFRTRSGEILTVLLSIHPLELANEKCLITMFKDITARVRMERELRVARERLAANLEAVTRLQGVSSLLAGEDGFTFVLDRALEAAMDITGADMGSIQLFKEGGKRMKVVAHRGFGSRFKQSRDPRADGEAADRDIAMRGERVLVPDTEQEPFSEGSPDMHLSAGVRSVQTTPLVSRSGAVLGNFTTYFRQAQQWDEGMLQLLDLLARQVADIVEREQAADDLRRAKQEADEANKSKSLFLANMSHEIRTPMNGILGMTQLALKNDLPDNVREYLELARQSGMALLDIINDILDLSRIESGKAVLQIEPFPLRELLEGTFHSFRAVAWEKGQGIRYFVDPALPETLAGDQGRLRQILTNLVGNALKFSDKGLVRVYVGPSDEPHPPGEAVLLFQITDDGVGIPADRLGMIFDAFSQVGQSSHAKYGGTGLGLSIAKNLVELMRGRIWVESIPGKGSTFSFTARFGLDESRREPPKESKGEAAGPPDRTLKVLLAEDNAVNRYLATTLLANKGHQVTAVENGAQALEALAGEPFDVVFMDVRMPGVGGEEATRRIRAGEVPGLNPHIPIVAMTAHALKGDRERFLEAGMDDYMAKPLDLEALDRILAQLCERKSCPAE